MVDVAGVLGREARARLRPPAAGAALAPQLATSADAPPTEAGWLSERKLDGVRLLVHVEGGEVRMRSRTGTERSGTFPELIEGVRDLAAASDGLLVADAEVVAFDGERDVFGRLQLRLGDPRRPTAARRDVPVHLYVFDLLVVDGLDLRPLPNLARKRVLASLPFTEPVRYTEHRDADLAGHLDEACARGWEGLIAKRADAPYRGGRGHSWRKLKCLRTGRFVVGGWTEPQGRRSGLGALLVGTVHGEEIRYAGRVGTGFDDATLATLGAHLPRAERPTAPFVDPPAERGLRWVVPHLVVEVRFAGWTEAGRLRFPSLEALRPDLAPGAAVGDDRAPPR